MTYRHQSTGDDLGQRHHPDRPVKAHAEQATCGSCGAPLTDVATLCHGCVDDRDGMRDLLGKLTAHVIGAEAPGKGPLRVAIGPGYGRSTHWDTPRREASNLPRMLREATARQTRFAAEQGVRVKGGGEPSLAVDHKAGDRMVQLQRVIARLVVDTVRATDTTPDVLTWGGVARWLDVQMPAVRRQDWAPAALADLRRVTKAAEKHVDRPPDRAYLGPCGRSVPGTDVDACPGEYLALEGEHLATCTGCGAEVDVATRKRQLLAEAADRWLTARTIENLTVTLGFERVKDSTVESWGSRGQIARQRIPSPTRSGEGPWHFLLGDVLTRLEAARVRRSA